MRTTGMIPIVLPLCVSQAACVATTWYVAPSPLGDNSNPGTQEQPFPTIQRGIDTASVGDTVIVAQGTYVENISFKGNNITLRSTDPLAPDVVAKTIIDGNQAGSVVPFAGTEDETCVLSGFTIRNGHASYGGGGISGGADPDYTHATIRNNGITGNFAEYGGGLYGCHGISEDNTISANSATRGGGLYACHGTVHNNVISDNSSRESAGGLSSCRGVIRNCIIWGNTALTHSQLRESVLPSYSCIMGWTGGGERNINTDPRFADPHGPDNDPDTYDDNNYRLSSVSPCVDTGMNEDWMWEAIDVDGNPRMFYGGLSKTVDMGAYEYGSWPFSITEVMKGSAGQTELTWGSRAEDTYTIWSCVDLGAGAWNQEQTIASGGKTTTWTDLDTASPHKFYRIKIE